MSLKGYPVQIVVTDAYLNRSVIKIELAEERKKFKVNIVLDKKGSNKILSNQVCMGIAEHINNRLSEKPAGDGQ